MKRTNLLTKFAIYVLLITIITLILVSSTYAKYTTTLTGSDTATVAKFAVGGLDSSSFNLFDTTVKEVNATTTDTDVANDRIAPGTGGKFAITLTNDSEVSVNYVLSIQETSNTSNVPIEYSLDGTTYVTAANFASQANASGKLEVGSTTQQTKTLTVYWRWAFTGSASTNFTSSQTDTTDTTLGTAATAPTVVVTASAQFDQAD